MLLQGSECEGLYKLDFSSFPEITLSKRVHSNVCTSNIVVVESPTPHIYLSLNQLKMSSVVLDQQLVHSSSQTFAVIIKNNNKTRSATILTCVACVVGESCKLPFSES